ncbi:MAG TPA: PH domain-containing protein [Candidatus Paceibacterota bacterium]|nr:PH domain-containing protein [Candidatus Paceibacterota bacterium]
MKEFDLAPGEHVVLEVRKHWFLFVLELLPYAIVAIIPFSLPKLLLLAPNLAPYAGYFDYNAETMRVLLGLWLLTAWTAAWGAFTRYFLNLWILTNDRIVEVKQRRFFSHEVSSLVLSRVQDVTTDIEGVLPSLLGIGTIKVQSAGAEVDFIMQGIPRPEEMRNLIMRYMTLGGQSAPAGA